MKRIRKTAPIREKRRKELDNYDTDFIDLPWLPEVDQVIVVPLKTIYRNVSAATWASERPVVRHLDSGLGLYIARLIEAM